MNTPKSNTRRALPGAQLIVQLKVVKLFFQLVNNPTDTRLVFKLSNLLNNEARKFDPQEVSRYLRARETYRQALEQQYRPAPYSLEDLAGCAPGTLGQAYYTHMTSNGFRQDFYPPVELVDDLSYLELRGRETHDIWHVVSGYGVDVVGEVSLLAFYLAQAESEDVFAMVLIAAGCAHAALRAPQLMGRMIQGISDGYARGKDACNFYPVKWEEMWDEPLARVRANLNITPAGLEPALSFSRA